MIYKLQNGKVIKRKIKNTAPERQSIFTRMMMNSVMNDPYTGAVATASGWTRDKEGNVTQTEEAANSEGAKKLRATLAEIAAMPLTDLAVDVAGAAVVGTKTYKAMKLARELNKALKAGEFDAAVDMARAASSGAVKTLPKGNLVELPESSTLSMTPDDIRYFNYDFDLGNGYSGYTPTSQSKAGAQFVEDIDEAVKMANARGGPGYVKSDEINFPINKINGGGEHNVYVDPNDSQKLLKTPFFGFGSKDRALEVAIDHARNRNKLYNIPLNVEGVAQKDGLWFPVYSQRKVSTIPEAARSYSPEQADQLMESVDRFARRIGADPISPFAEKYPINNVFLENELDPLSLGKVGKDFRLYNIGMADDGTLIGFDLRKNGGIIKFQNAGTLPKWMQKLNSWSIPDSDESAGERILNSTIEQANDASTQEERDQIYKDSAKKNLAVTGQSLMMLPMLEEFATYGLLGGGLRLGTGIAGSKAGEYVLGKGGDWADKKLNTKFLGTTGRIIGGLGGWWGGSSTTTPLFRNLAGKGITLHMPQETFINLRGQYFDRAAKNIKLNASALPKLQYHDRLMKDYLEFGPDSNINGDNVSKLVHWDPMTTGRKSALPINGGFSRDPMYFPHFENGKLVPAIGQIRSKLGDGHLYAHPYHPIFFGANRPWWEVPKSNLSDMFLESTTVDKSIYSGPKQNFKHWYRRQRKYASDMRKWYEKYGPQNRSARYLITDPENLADYEFNYKLGIMGSEVPMSKLEGFEYDPLLGTFKRARYTDPSATIVSPQEAATTYHFDGRMPLSRPISEAERLGIPKAGRSTLNSDQTEAIDDLLWYLRNGRHKKYFLYNPETETFRWSSSKAKDGEMGAVRALIEHGATSSGHYEDAPVRLSNEYGNFTIWPDKNAAFTSNFPIPEGMKWGPGETSLMLEGDHGMKTILTSPRVDLSASMEDAPIELVNSLPNTIDKSIMRRFWSENDKMIRPGTYLSGDNGQMPLGNIAISAFDRTKSVDSAIQSIINPKNARTGRMGLSPDSYSSIIRQGLRGNHKLRWGEGFTKWNDSAVENRAIYEAWKKMNAGEITPEQYKQIFDDWAIPLGGRPVEIRTTPSFRTITDNNGITRTIAQEPQKYVVMPHPYIMYRKQGGKI